MIPRISHLSDSRQVATAVNRALKGVDGFPFPRLDSAPPAPEEGQTYYDLTLHKARVFDGTVWNALW